MDYIGAIFDRLDDWRHLPKFRLEPHADVFFSLYLSDILSSELSVAIEGIIPEFPIWKGIGKPNYPYADCCNVDYLAKVKDAREVILVELKTDDSSTRDEQDAYLEAARQAGMAKLLDGIRRTYEKTAAKKKYSYLLCKLQEMGFITLEGKAFRTTETQYGIRVVYIMPNDPEGLDYVISFERVAQIVERRKDEFSMRFARSLREWAGVKAGDRPCKG